MLYRLSYRAIFTVLTGFEPVISCVTGRRDNPYTIGPLLREQDLNLRPSGYEPDELPSCSTPRQIITIKLYAVLTIFRIYFILLS